MNVHCAKGNDIAWSKWGWLHNHGSVDASAIGAPTVINPPCSLNDLYLGVNTTHIVIRNHYVTCGLSTN
jgi:hypothetical protein